LAAEAAEDVGFSGRAGQLRTLYQGEAPRRLLLVGLGKADDFDVTAAHLAVAKAVWEAEELGVRTLALAPPPLGDDAEFAARHLALAAELAAFRFDAYKSAEERSRPRLEELIVLGEAALEEPLRQSALVARHQNYARELVTEPVNVMTPVEFAARVSTAAAEVGLGVEVHDEAWIRERGMELIGSVARGAAEVPRLVVLRHRGAGDDAPWTGLVGKSVMFDTGGYNLKGKGMELMKGDMGGGAAVVGAMLAVAELKLPVNVLAVLPAVVNSIGADAYKPSDVIRSFAGPSVEIGNTDAEGRLTLADGLSYARELGTERLVDVCTLTGASMVALGLRVGALMTNDAALRAAVLDGAARTGELFWELPLFPHYDENLKSDVAEVKSTGGRPGGAINAAKFLERFVGETPWAHLDIASKEFTDKPYGAYRKGATGFAMRTLVNLLMAK
ncbi:MAG: aminopeptidase, partial [Candidatus Coatesbacteria bacterium]|nr:aminopeptidase [Candidatus Coatesbacteria bacterium]